MRRLPVASAISPRATNATCVGRELAQVTLHDEVFCGAPLASGLAGEEVSLIAVSLIVVSLVAVSFIAMSLGSAASGVGGVWTSPIVGVPLSLGVLPVSMDAMGRSTEPPSGIPGIIPPSPGGGSPVIAIRN